MQINPGPYLKNEKQSKEKDIVAYRDNLCNLREPFKDRRTDIVIDYNQSKGMMVFGLKENCMQKIKVLTQEMKCIYAF